MTEGQLAQTKVTQFFCFCNKSVLRHERQPQSDVMLSESECVGVRSGRCGWEERGMGWKKDVWRKEEKESKRERASSTL